MRLKTFQRLSRVQRLCHDGVLVGDWSHVPRGTEAAYARMVAVMAEQGISCAGRPPVWAWAGPLTLMDAALLLDPAHELSQGYATLAFDAPADLVLLTDYGDWCDAVLADVARWTPGPVTTGRHPAQATLPLLRLEWVSDVVPLPTLGWDELDLDQPV